MNAIRRLGRWYFNKKIATPFQATVFVIGMGARRDHPVDAMSSRDDLEWWGSECRSCDNATPGCMVCDCCDSDEFTVPLWMERALHVVR